jgi:hypothetical protein
MKNFLKFTPQINAVLIIVLIVSLNTLPQRIKKSIESSNIKNDTIISEKIITANIETKNNFIYFEGRMISESVKMSEYFAYHTNFPEVIFDGYLTPVMSTDKGEYYLWSKYKVNEKTLTSLSKIKGWFVTNEYQFQSVLDSKKNYQILYPIVEKDIVP